MRDMHVVLEVRQSLSHSRIWRVDLYSPRLTSTGDWLVNFADCLSTTELLSLYLCIRRESDILCIIQNSAEDKTVEISAMESIYGNSVLTLAVINAKGVTKGLLETKPQLAVNIPCRSHDGQSGTIQVSPQKTINLWQEPLYTRAWCLQENVLSARLLLFTDDEVLWQCAARPMLRPNTTHVDYTYDDPTIHESHFNRVPEAIFSAGDQDRQISQNDFLELRRYTIWRWIVPNYTRRNLTVLSDRLPAIAGIARKFKESWDDELCCWNLEEAVYRIFDMASENDMARQ